MIQFLIGFFAGIIFSAAVIFVGLTATPDDDLDQQRSDFGNPFGGGV